MEASLPLSRPDIPDDDRLRVVLVVREGTERHHVPGDKQKNKDKYRIIQVELLSGHRAD